MERKIGAKVLRRDLVSCDEVSGVEATEGGGGVELELGSCLAGGVRILCHIVRFPRTNGVAGVSLDGDVL